MDHRRTSTSYAAQVAPPPQRFSEPYQQRPPSYRRPPESHSPLDFAPEDATILQAAPARPVMVETAPRSASHHGLAPLPGNEVSRSSHRRRQSQAQGPPALARLPQTPPAAPDIPRGPPPSFRNPFVANGPPQPYIPPHFAARPHSMQSDGFSRPSSHSYPTRRVTDTHVPPHHDPQDRRGPTSISTDRASIATGSRRDSSARRASAGERRPSVPDRSPLQKLEVKLDDISKEERRARILEAELAAQEKAEAVARRAREVARKHQTGDAPYHIGRPRRHVSTRVPNAHVSPELDGPVFDGSTLDSPAFDGPAFDMSEPWDPNQPTAHRQGHQAPPKVHPDGEEATSASHRRKSMLPSGYLEGPPARQPSVRNRDLDGAARSSGTTDRSSWSTAPTEPRRRQDSLRNPAPTGLGLSGLEDPESAHYRKQSRGANISRYESHRLSKDLPPTPKASAQSVEDRRESRNSRGSLVAQGKRKDERPSRLKSLRHQLKPEPMDANAAPSHDRLDSSQPGPEDDTATHPTIASFVRFSALSSWTRSQVSGTHVS